MSTIDPHTSLAALVLDEPRRAELFEGLGFDYCCRGARSLATVCAQHDLDVDTAVGLTPAAGIGPAAGRAALPVRRARARLGDPPGAPLAAGLAGGVVGPSPGPLGPL